ncbi:hypothetical protein GJ688_00100 [Heliobacillus mobilis]|uniref:PadR family transcriptional regulator n=1 Tax=Heliobacterium mobile TaxID=28064 RepID=A0A6I3SBV0_HELMO|nr:PadR family transcriptional regulator [Heliobacterium mobile]MTV47379.1 hypothetical protein [Heliobacterium mobile]
MSLKHALLGFLSYNSMTGYQLKQYVDESVQHFWNASLSQIYPTLSQMEKEGLLTMEVEYQEEKPNRKIYHITDAGRQELQRWLREPTNLPSVREAFLIKVFFGGTMEKEDILSQMNQYLKLHRDLLAMYQGPVLEKMQQEAANLERDSFFWALTLEAGINLEKAWIEWLEESIEKIKKYATD